MSQEQLPAFRKPPVVETVMGLQFEPLPKFTNGHIGLFWAALGGVDVWPVTEDQPPLPPQEVERFGEEKKWSRMDMIRFGLTQIPEARVHFWSKSRDRLVQVQNGRLIYNWAMTPGSPYARYRVIRPEFDKLFAQFTGFLSQNGLPPLTPNQWEVTYVNHIPKGTLWNDVRDWNRVFSFPFTPPAAVNDSFLESVGSHWIYEIPNQRTRLRIQTQHGRNKDDVEILVFKLTATGAMGEEGCLSLDEGFQLGHRIIVKAFTALTSTEAHAFWESEF